MTHNQRPLKYRKSSRSGGSGGNCVEWAYAPFGVYIRDSKDPQGPSLFVTPTEWSELLAAARLGSPHAWILRRPTGVDLDKTGVRLRFTVAEWAAFVDGIIAGECDQTTLSFSNAG